MEKPIETNIVLHVDASELDIAIEKTNRLLALLQEMQKTGLAMKNGCSACEVKCDEHLAGKISEGISRFHERRRQVFP